MLVSIKKTKKLNNIKEINNNIIDYNFMGLFSLI